MKSTLSIALSLSLAACGSSNSGQPGIDAPNHKDGNGGGSDAPGTGSDGSTSAKGTIFTILLENHDYAEIVGSSNAPYINSLIAKGGLATNYKDSGTHPSLPNYLFLISGATQYFGGVDLDPTFFPFPVAQPNLGTQLETASIKWRAYAEGAGTAGCALAASGEYAPKHDPFLYFTDQQKGMNNLCANTNVDYSQFASDLAGGQYRYMWITPNLLDDGHDPQADPVTGLKQSDAWLATEVPKIMASDAYKNGGVLFITWDEAEGRNNDDPDQIPMIILSPKIKSAGMTSNTAFTHASYLATVEDMLALPRLDTVKTSTNLMEFMMP